MTMPSNELVNVSVASWIAADNQSRVERGLDVNSFEILDRQVLGSHGAGFAGPKSDLDICVIYRHRPAVYLCPIEDPTFAVPAVHKTDSIDVHGIDVRTFLAHVYAHKLSVWNYLSMAQGTAFVVRLREVARKMLSPHQLVRAYYHYARSLLEDGQANAIRIDRSLGRHLSAVHAILRAWQYLEIPSMAISTFGTLSSSAEMFDREGYSGLPTKISDTVNAAIELRTGMDTRHNADKLLRDLIEIYQMILKMLPDVSIIQKDLQHCPKRLAILREFTYEILTER